MDKREKHENDVMGNISLPCDARNTSIRDRTIVEPALQTRELIPIGTQKSDSMEGDRMSGCEES